MGRKNKKKHPITVVGAVRVIGYIRVSTERQADEGHSLEVQQERLRMHAALHNMEIVGYEIDAGLSASSLDRPGLQRALAAIRNCAADGLLVTRLDRLTRSVRDFAELVDEYFATRARLISVNESIDTGTPTGRLILNVLMSVSQWEREAAAERTASVMAHMRAAGKYTGGRAPFGWTVDEEGSLRMNDAELEIIAKAKALRAEGRTLRVIAGAIGMNPRTGREFDPMAVSRMLEDSAAAARWVSA